MDEIQESSISFTEIHVCNVNSTILRSRSHGNKVRIREGKEWGNCKLSRRTMESRKRTRVEYKEYLVDE